MAYVVGEVEVSDFSSALRLATAPLRTGQTIQTLQTKQVTPPARAKDLRKPKKGPKKTTQKQVLAPEPKKIIPPPTLEVKDTSSESDKQMMWGVFALIAAGGLLWYMMRRK